LSTEHYSFNNDDQFSYFSVTTDNISYSYTNILMQLLRLVDEWFRRFYNDGWSRWAFGSLFSRCLPSDKCYAMYCRESDRLNTHHCRTAHSYDRTLQQVVWRFSAAVCPNRLYCLSIPLFINYNNISSYSWYNVGWVKNNSHYFHMRFCWRLTEYLP